MSTLAIILSTSLASVIFNCYPEDFGYEEIVETAQNHCKNVKPEEVDVDLLWDLAETEIRYNVPHEFRGMLLAAACMESGYNTQAEGDHRFSKNNRPKAIGLFQMWPWWENKKWGYGIDRREHVGASDAYMKHIVRVVKKTEKKCKFKTEKKKWIAGWVTAIRSPKPGGRCHEAPNHYRLLKKWHKMIEETPVPCGC